MEDMVQVALQGHRYCFSHDLVFILAYLELAYRFSGTGNTKNVSSLSHQVFKITALPYFSGSVSPHSRDRMGLFSGLEKSRDSFDCRGAQDFGRMHPTSCVQTESSLAIGALSLSLHSGSSLRSLEVDQKQIKLPYDGELPYPLLLYFFDFLPTFSDVPNEEWR